MKSAAFRFTPAARRLLFVALSPLAGVGLKAAEPAWAYGFAAPPKSGETAVMPGPPERTLRPKEDPKEQTRKRRVEGSTREYSLLEIRNANAVIDWFPDEHPPLTPIMQKGPASLGANAYGCAACHMPHGKGRPENAPVAGLPAAYIVRQLQDMRKGLRTSADPRKADTLLMIALAKAMTDAEMKEAASYFESIPWAPWVRVIETDRVPKTKLVTNAFVPLETARTQPIAGRIIEVPENVEQAELLNPRSGFIAYVPVGSVKKGELLATAPPAGKTIACNTCHGQDFNGLAEVPGIAGRSPSYIVRQLYDIQQGARKSPLSQVMLAVVANLTNDDFVALAAYISSREP